MQWHLGAKVMKHTRTYMAQLPSGWRVWQVPSVSSKEAFLWLLNVCLTPTLSDQHHEALLSYHSTLPSEPLLRIFSSVPKAMCPFM